MQPAEDSRCKRPDIMFVNRLLPARKWNNTHTLIELTDNTHLSLEI